MSYPIGLKPQVPNILSVKKLRLGTLAMFCYPFVERKCCHKWISLRVVFPSSGESLIHKRFVNFLTVIVFKFLKVQLFLSFWPFYHRKVNESP